jgi:hypothetical protein
MAHTQGGGSFDDAGEPPPLFSRRIADAGELGDRRERAFGVGERRLESILVPLAQRYSPLICNQFAQLSTYTEQVTNRAKQSPGERSQEPSSRRRG